jgi:hypothetical protein
MDYDGIVYKAFNAVLDRANLRNKVYEVSASASFTTGDKPNYALDTGRFSMKDKFKMLKQLVKNMEGVYDRKTIKDLNIDFKSIEIPSGGAYKSDKKREDIYKPKGSVIQIKNDDNNCFWYALTTLIYKKKKVSNMNLLERVDLLEKNMLENYVILVDYLGMKK